MYADFEYYAEQFCGGLIPEDAFAGYAARVGREIDRLTMGRAAEAGADMAPRLSVCCCEIAELLYRADRADELTAGGAIAAQTNDGLSTTFAAAKAAGTRSAGGAITAAAVRWLTAPQNLIYPGV